MRVQAECRKTGLFIPFAALRTSPLPNTRQVMIDLEIVGVPTSTAEALSQEKTYKELRNEAYEERYLRKEERSLKQQVTAQEIEEIDRKFDLKGVTSLETLLERLS